MNRRDLLRAVGGAAAASLLAPLTPEERLRLGTVLHARRRPGRYQTLDARQASLVAELAETIIPATDTPGAKDVGITEFVDLLLTEWYTAEERDAFLRGLAAIDAAARAEGAPFADLGADARARVLTPLDGAQGPLDGAAGAFARMKSLTVYGYFTSREVQTQVLETVIIPGRYDGCATMERG
jgi:hypothetical protein